MITTMPWGKHRGELIADVPTGYLAWLADRELSPDMRVAIEDELRRRLRLDDPPPPPPRGRNGHCPAPAMAHELIRAGLCALARRHHPDMGGDTTTMQTVNAAADWLRQQLEGSR